MSPEDLQKPSTNFDFEDDSVFDEFLEEIRSRLAEETDMSPAETEDEFSDPTILAYLTEHGIEEHSTALESIQRVVSMAIARLNQRPGSGHETEGPRAHSDDPVGLARDRKRFNALHEKRQAIKAAMEAELKVARGGR